MKRSKEKIVFLDAGTVDFNDVSLKSISKLGKLVLHHKTKPSQIISRIRGARIVITNKCRFDAEIFLKSPKLKCLCLAATGTNNIDLAAAKAQGVAVANVARYSTSSVVQFTFLFLLALASRFPALDAWSRNRWSRSPFFNLPVPRIFELQGKTLGILGFGAIGRRVAQIAKMFGMKILVAKIPGRKYGRQESSKRKSLNEVVRNADFLTIHTPLTPLTRHLINGRVIRMMKKSACLINMARGGIVDETALAHALRSGRIAGAAADVLSEEPPSRRHPLLKAPHFLMTPHVAWASVESRKRLVLEIARNIQAFQQGKQRNRVV